MCSTPRCSTKPRSTRRLPESASAYKTYSQVMRNASQRYEQRQRELAKQRAERANREQKEKQSTLNLEYESINKKDNAPLEEPDTGFFMRIIHKLFSFTERKPTRIYHEYR